ncbi:HalD/BesD family halogenase [Flavimaricola marinus]|uniref:Fe2OG dioxygenase domain-containing protein n=1 Tax=Flavimaricola marinus TaxID=1819565 RepID=A0A238LFE9_9RHOB|nr:2OG-Fe(II) oxygenase [Flavimaricola marinus]SMY08361.1 hypothetical protein LOM8899_02512 [Flavimaricola marinus]
MESLINLDDFPLDAQGSSGWTALVERCKAALAAEGMFNLEGFLKPQTCKDILHDLRPRFATEAFTHSRSHNIYFRDTVDGLAPDHPALHKVTTVNHTLCADQIGGGLDQLYRWAPFRAFLAAVMDKPALYEMDDALARHNVMAYRAGEGLNWHFDRSEFTTTLLLQAPDAGGSFEYRSDLRTETDPNFDGVAKLLRGHDPAKRSLSLAPGTLNVFRGKNTAHRVTPVKGDKDRIIAVFSYFETPGVQFSAKERLGFYGRT